MHQKVGDALSAPVIGPVAAPQLHLMTLNIRRRMAVPISDADRWSRREPLLRQLLERERPSVLGIQEALPDQAADIAEALGPRYAMAGTGRDADRGGERCELLIDTERLRFVDVRTRWLSDRPDVPGSRSYGNLLPRVVVQAELEDVQLGSRFWVLVTHLDHLSRRSRRESAIQLQRTVAALQHPAVVMGDFNVDVDSEVFRELTRNGLLVDAWQVAMRRLTPPWGTFSRYRPPRPDGPRLDWMLVSPSAVVDAAAINAARFGQAAVSDHEPVHALVRWPAAETPSDGPART